MKPKTMLLRQFALSGPLPLLEERFPHPAARAADLPGGEVACRNGATVGPAGSLFSSAKTRYGVTRRGGRLAGANLAVGREGEE